MEKGRKTRVTKGAGNDLYHPTNADGKRESHTVYAKTLKECEKLLETMIEEVRNRIKAEKEQRKNETETAS